ncbi:unnamed protein product, partial [Polarella glacialis]
QDQLRLHQLLTHCQEMERDIHGMQGQQTQSSADVSSLQMMQQQLEALKQHLR